MTTVEQIGLVGEGVDRVDGPLKVTGAADYPNDFSYPDLAHAALVRSTVAAGRITRLDISAAQTSPGVLAVITHRNAPVLGRAPDTFLSAPPTPLQDDRIHYHGQYVAMVVAGTAEEATAAARLIEADYEKTEPILDIHDPRAELITDPWGLDASRGDAEAALASAEVRFEATYTTAGNANSPMGLFTTVAAWDGDALTVHDSTQWPGSLRTALARVFAVPESGVRVLAPFVGGGFGAGLRTWPHVILAALAARTVGRPVKLVLTRPEMFTGIGHRTETVQRLRIGATRDGRLVALDHESTTTLQMEGNNLEPCATVSESAYACPNVSTRDRQVRLNITWCNSMRAPGDAQGNFALESAMDELSYTLGIDPIELRLRNYADVHPQLGLPWSSNALRECYEVGADLFGWSRRRPEPGSMRDGDWLIGYGMAGVSFFWYQAPCTASATLRKDGTALVRSAVTDIGTGTWTVMTQLSAELLGLDLERVTFELGDSDLPPGAQAGGSGLTAGLGNAVHAACRNLVQAFLDTVRDDPTSPLAGCALDEVGVDGGRIHRTGSPERGESYTDILAAHGLAELTADGASTPNDPQELGLAPAGPFGARFVEVRVDPELGLLRLARVVSAIDAGRILNEKTATSQIIGGTVGGIGMAMFEEIVTDPGSGRITNATFGDYLIPVNADVPDMQVVFVGRPDRFNPIGVKGVGEIGLVGIGAAIANAVHHATGRRIRSLPITIDRLL
ncbi:xanthine dehydrogenase family protein molybdopterin-binding subunit [Nonomuraea sediminis]|uniref:xanthine dehydrogenase family protein molybdopterin-binding subunit n=1 Tax=Nonomuraea sediminis TaxID=2835864 RepID=UPI001BDD77A8|nr:xanthine dehydrogenase family protein molybdopterin-binding subunit [Nonomuraea sediminis]